MRRLGGGFAHPANLANPSRQGSTQAPREHILRLRSAAMRLDPNTHAFVMATALLTSISFAIAAMSVLALAIHLFIPGAG